MPEANEGNGQARPPLLVNPAREGFFGGGHAIVSGFSRHHTMDPFSGPASVKSVRAGEGVWSTAVARHVVRPGSLLFLNDGETYALDIHAQQPVRTFCLFFAQGTLAGVLRALTRPPERGLDDPFEDLPGVELPAVVIGAGCAPDLGAAMERLWGQFQGGASVLALDDGVEALAASAVGWAGRAGGEADRLDAVRAATRMEIYRRLHIGREYLREFALAPGTTFRDAARACCMAPHHFHRCFTQAFGVTPNKWLQELRLDWARKELAERERRATDVAMDLGFGSLAAFSRFVRRRTGVSPRALRSGVVRI